MTREVIEKSRRTIKINFRLFLWYTAFLSIFIIIYAVIYETTSNQTLDTFMLFFHLFLAVYYFFAVLISMKIGHKQKFIRRVIFIVVVFLIAVILTILSILGMLFLAVLGEESTYLIAPIFIWGLFHAISSLALIISVFIYKLIFV